MAYSEITGEKNLGYIEADDGHRGQVHAIFAGCRRIRQGPVARIHGIYLKLNKYIGYISRVPLFIIEKEKVS